MLDTKQRARLDQLETLKIQLTKAVSF